MTVSHLPLWANVREKTLCRMRVTPGGQERTLPELRSLAKSAGWRLTVPKDHCSYT